VNIDRDRVGMIFPRSDGVAQSSFRDRQRKMQGKFVNQFKSRILSAPPELLSQFRFLVVEADSLDEPFDRFAFELISTRFNKFLQFFWVVHIHPNNCCGVARNGSIEVPRMVEITFLI